MGPARVSAQPPSINAMLRQVLEIEKRAGFSIIFMMPLAITRDYHIEASLAWFH
jgi:hypothetical protein